MNMIYEWITFLFPFGFLEMTFMKNAFLGILIVAPMLGLLSTMVVNQKMTFFSDAIGHSALTGIGLGVLFGIHQPTVAMCLFAIVLGISISVISYKRPHMTDMVIGVFSAGTIALGTMILSKGGNFNQYTNYLIGDLLSVAPSDLGILCAVGAIALLFWYLVYNQLVLTSINVSLANSRRIHTLIVQIIFTILVAVVVVLCIPWIGILLINAFLILPAAISGNIARNLREYQLYAVGIALLSGVIGLGVAYYLGTSAGATIAVIMVIFYLASAIKAHFIK